MALEYREYETILATANSVQPDDMSAFGARLKMLRMAGVPKTPTVGKGKRLRYTQLDLWETQLALAMAEVGVQPIRIVQFFEKYVRPVGLLVAAHARVDDDYFLVIETHLNAGKAADLRDVGHDVKMNTFANVVDHIRDYKSGALIVINLTKLMKEVEI